MITGSELIKISGRLVSTSGMSARFAREIETDWSTTRSGRDIDTEGSPCFTLVAGVGCTFGSGAFGAESFTSGAFGSGATALGAGAFDSTLSST